ncbi:MAG: Gx transporter family protein [Magnetococcales bacterium]|nr:Gx transporter family protein [Magnetococcales bacterium]
MSRIRQPRQVLWIAYLAAAATGTHMLETGLPGFGPWIKPGLANTFSLIALFRLGYAAAVVVTVVRILVSSLVLGTLFSPTFMMSFAGGSGALLMMALLLPLMDRSQFTMNGEVCSQALNKWLLGPVGVSLLASIAHIVMQLVVAWLLLIGHSGIFFALPWFLFGSWLTGIINGLLAYMILKNLPTGC